MHFKNAELKDLDRIVEIYNSTINDRMATADTAFQTTSDKKDWFENHNSENRPIWIVEDDDSNFIGWVSIQDFYGRPAYSGTAEISIYLAAEHRSKGLGKIILEKAIKKCRGLALHTLLGFIFAHNKASIKLFENAGFTEYGLLPDVAYMDEQPFSLCIMGKKI
jgi:phosphinothricin acetyltransferase